MALLLPALLYTLYAPFRLTSKQQCEWRTIPAAGETSEEPPRANPLAAWCGEGGGKNHHQLFLIKGVTASVAFDDLAIHNAIDVHCCDNLSTILVYAGDLVMYDHFISFRNYVQLAEF